MLLLASIASGMDLSLIPITLNGKPMDLPVATSICQLLVLAGHGERRVAVECNGAIVPRSQHLLQMLQAGDRVEIVQAIGGG